MQAPDLRDLCFQLIERTDGTGKMKDICTMLHSVFMGLNSECSNPFSDDQKIDKDVERRVKQLLYRLETLLHEIEKQELFPSSEKPDATLTWLSTELFRDSLQRLYTRESVTGSQFKVIQDHFIKLLLDSNSSPVVAVLGKPGSGKSTLARLAFNDPGVNDYYPSKLFISMTYPTYKDHDFARFHLDFSYDYNALREYSFESNISPERKLWSGLYWQEELKYILEHLKRQSDGKKCLLVLDDLSDVEMLVSLLSVNENGSFFSSFVEAKGTKIVITSSIQFEDVGVSAVRLPSLTEDESWDLFQKIAFLDQDWRPCILQICQICEHIPAVIYIIASILSLKSTREEQEDFLNLIMTSIPHPTTIICSTLKLTELHCYHKVQKNWRHCFAWCSLLPKDYEFGKDCMFQLWRAQEVFWENDGMTEEELEECFTEFLKSGYFLVTNGVGSIARYKISYLVSELMKYVAGDDFCLLEKSTTEPNHKIVRHASFIVDPSWEPPFWLPEAKQLQSLLLWTCNSGEPVSLSKIESALSCITHLRTFLVDAVSIDFSCEIPALNKLMSLYPKYIITKKLVLESGDAFIPEDGTIREQFAFVENACFNNPGPINFQSIFLYGELTSLNTYQTLESLVIHQWKGEIIAHTREINDLSDYLRSLLSIQITNCRGCQYLPGFNTLPLLSSLQLQGLLSLLDISISDDNNEASSESFYPSLERLVLFNLPELKGWSSKEVHYNQHTLQRFSFPVLTEVRVQGCPKLIAMPSMPMVKSLEAINVDAKLLNQLLGASLTITSPSKDNQELTETSKRTKTPNFDGDDGEITFLKTYQTPEILEVRQWKGDIFPAWTIGKLPDFLRNLVSIQIANCNGCQYLPGINTLPHLESLQLWSMYSLVDIVINDETSSAESFHPSLKCLVLSDLPQLKGWSTNEADEGKNILQQYCFPVLTKVRVLGCPKLISMPSVPGLESLEAINVKAKLMDHLLCLPVIDPLPNEDSKELTETSKKHLSLVKNPEISGCEKFEWTEKPTTVSKGVSHTFRGLRSLKLINFPELGSLPGGVECMTMLEQLSLYWLTNLRVLPAWIGEFTQLRQLIICYCPKLTMFPNSDGNFSSLEELEIRYCPRLIQFPESLPNLKKLRVKDFSGLKLILSVSQNLEELEIDNCDSLVGVWEGLKRLYSLKLSKIESLTKIVDFDRLTELRRLIIQKCPELTSLPDSLGALSTLEHLKIHSCPGLICLPPSISDLRSLKQLEIRVSPQLEKRCQKPTGEDWPLIQYIPNVICGNSLLNCK